MDVSYIIKNKHGVHANSADPTMAALKHSRAVFVSEMENGDCLKASKLKALSGIDRADFAIAGRLIYVFFQNIFCDNPIKDNERLVDYTLDERIKAGEFNIAM